jgi:hypothetical protein
MPVLFWTTVHRSMRQTRIKTQNIIVFTVEFTRIPLFPAGEKLRHRPHHPLDARRFRKVTETQRPERTAESHRQKGAQYN